MVKVSCPNEGCSELFIKSQFDDHIQKCQYSQNLNTQINNQDASSNHGSCTPNKGSTTQQCCFAFLGCQFAGSSSELVKHMEDHLSSHLEYIYKVLLEFSHSSHKSGGAISTNEGNQSIKHLLFNDIEKSKQTLNKLSRKVAKPNHKLPKCKKNRRRLVFD